jgi:hypothetical protein
MNEETFEKLDEELATCLRVLFEIKQIEKEIERNLRKFRRTK